MALRKLGAHLEKSPNLLGCSGDKLLEKQIAYVQELTLSQIDTSQIKEIMESFDSEIPKIMAKRKEEYLKPKNRWNDAGWYFNVQKQSIAHIYQTGGAGICYNCCKSMKHLSDAMQCKYVFILSHSKIPDFLCKKFIRLYLICPKCEDQSKIISTPETWIEALASMVYNEANHKMITITEQLIKEQLIESLINKSQMLIERENKIILEHLVFS